MTRSKWIPATIVVLMMAASALAVAGADKKASSEEKPSATAVTIAAGDDGLTTTSRSQIDLSALPIRKLFGAAYAGSPKVALKGKPLSSELGNVDTIVRRPKDIVIKAGKGSGPLEIEAVSLESVKPVSIGGKNYQILLGLSQAAKESQMGKVSLTMRGRDGGTFSTSLPVPLRLVFTPEKGGQPVIIDCGAVPCGKGGKDIVLVAKSGSWAMTGGSSKFDPAALRIVTIKAGVRVGGDGFREYTTVGTSNFFAGVGITGGHPALRPFAHIHRFIVHSVEAAFL
jgi:hypothetical protein